MLNHSDLKDHIFVRTSERACFECTICGFILDDLVAKEFGIDTSELFILDYVPEKNTVNTANHPHNRLYDNTTDTIKNKYVPAFAEQMYDSSSLLTTIQKDMKNAQKEMQAGMKKDLFGTAKYPELMNPKGFGL